MSIETASIACSMLMIATIAGLDIYDNGRRWYL